ncbi:MAG TPA: non-heme iron oxygenase ferredoxin subunit [Limnochordales bacterium]
MEEGLTFVLPVSELPPGSCRRVQVGGRTLALWHTQHGIYATDDTCTHERASLSEGDFEPEAGQVACPKHGARFDVRSGKALTLPAYRPLRTYPVEVRDGQIVVRVQG